jgi:elongation factor Tu
VLTTKCTAVEMFRKVVDIAVAGDNVGLVLDRVGRDDVARGRWIRRAT